MTDEYATNHITLEDALSHRTGLPRHDLSYGGPNYTLRDAVRSLRYLPTTAELRTKFQYCNIMYKVVSYVIETLTGMWLGDFLRVRIWAPLHMNSTYFSPHDAEKDVQRYGKILATGYYWNEGSLNYGIEDAWHPGLEQSGDGAIISNVEDYAKWLHAMINMAPPISLAGHKALRTPRSFEFLEEVFPQSGPTTYSLGWNSINYRGQIIHQHQGGIPGFGTLMLSMPWRKWGVVMMGNIAETSNNAEMILAYDLIDSLLETPEDERINWLEKFEQDKNKQKASLQNGKKNLFPNTPAKSIPMSLPLEDYTGTYSHPAYQSFDLILVKPDKDIPLDDPRPNKVMHASINRTLDSAVYLDHVSADFFVLYGYVVRRESKQLEWVGKAEFRLGADGKVKEVGFMMEAAMVDDLIWFKKIA